MCRVSGKEGFGEENERGKKLLLVGGLVKKTDVAFDCHTHATN